MRDQPDESAARMSPRLELTASEFQAGLRLMTLPDREANLRMLRGTSPALATALRGLPGT